MYSRTTIGHLKGWLIALKQNNGNNTDVREFIR